MAKTVWIYGVMPEYVSPRESESGVVGRQSFPATVLPLTDSGAGTTPQGQPQQQVQQTTTVRGVDSESLLNQAIQRKAELQEQRSGITNQRSQLIKQLSTATVGKRGHTSPQAMAIQAQLNGLDKQEHSLDLQDKFVEFDTAHRLSAAYKNTADTEKFAKDNLAHQTAQQAGEVFLKGTEIMGRFKPGTQEFHDEMAKLKEQYPLGFASEAVKGHFGQIAKFHDQEMDRRQNQLTTQLFKDTKLSPEQFANATNIRATDASISTDPNNPTPLDTIEKQRSAKGKNIAFEVDGQTHLFTKGFFDNLSKVFRQPSKVAGIVAPAQTGTEPVGMVSTVRGQPLRPISAQAQTTTQAPAAVQTQEVTRVTPDGRKAIFDAATKKFLRYGK